VNHYKEIAEDYTNLVDTMGFSESQKIAPIEYVNDNSFIQFLPTRIVDSPEFQRLQRIYK
jgi:hypothetical protein